MNVSASAVRFLKKYIAPTLSPDTAAASAVAEAARQIRAMDWAYVRANLVAVLPDTHQDASSERERLDYYDSYTMCSEHTAVKYFHRVFAGAAMYRVKLPDAFAGAQLTGLSLRVACDPYNFPGVRLAVGTGDDPAPTKCWTCIREGSADPAKKMFLADAVHRRENAQGQWAGNTADVTVMPAGAPLTLGKYLWVAVTQEVYERQRNSYVEGAGMIQPLLTLAIDGEIEGYDDGAYIGGGYEDETPRPMIISAGELPAPWAAAPYREVAVVSHDIWETPPVPSHLMLSSANQWIGADGGQFTVAVTSLPDFWATFEVGELPAWITASVNAQTRAVTFSVQATAPGQSRSADIVFSSGGETATLHVDQQAEEITYLAVSPQSLSFIRAGGALTFTVTSLPNGVSVFAAAKQPAGTSWITVSVDGSIVTVTASAQIPGASTRAAAVRVTAGAATLDVPVAQDAGEPVTHLTLATQSVSAPATGASGTVAITSLPNGVAMASAEVTSAPGWITASVNAATGRVEWSASDNGGGQRSGNVIVSAGSEMQGFAVMQAANPSTLSVYPAGGLDSGDGGTLTATLTVPAGASAPSFASADGLSGTFNGSVLTVTVPANTGAPRYLTGTVTVTVGGTGYDVVFTVSQGGWTTVPFTSTVAKLSPAAMAILNQATTVTGVSDIRVYGDIAFICGTFTNLFGCKNMCAINLTSGAIIPWSSSDSLGTTVTTASFVSSRTAGISVARGQGCYILLFEGGTNHGYNYSLWYVKLSGGVLGRDNHTLQDSTKLNTFNAATQFASNGTNSFYIFKGTSAQCRRMTSTFVTSQIPYNYQYTLTTIKTFSGNARAIAYSNGYYYVAGEFGGSNLQRCSASGTTFAATAGDSNVPPAAQFAPNVWTGISIMFDPNDGKLVATGAFTSIGGAAVKHAAKWNGTGWVQYGVATPDAAVAAADAHSSGLVVAGAWTNYRIYTPPEEAAGTGIDPLPPIPLDETQAVCGVRDLYAKSFAGRIEPVDFTALNRASRQYGLVAALRREASAAGGPDRLRLCLSALLARFEVPESFLPGRLLLSPPGAGLLSIPEGATLSLTAWWAAGVYMGLADIAAVSHRADFWSGAAAAMSGDRAVVVGQSAIILRASLARVGRVTLDADAWALSSIEIPLADVGGRFGTMILSAWLHLDGIAAIPADTVLGLGVLDVADDVGWRPSVTLAG